MAPVRGIEATPEQADAARDCQRGARTMVAIAAGLAGPRRTVSEGIDPAANTLANDSFQKIQDYSLAGKRFTPRVRRFAPFDGDSIRPLAIRMIAAPAHNI